MADLYDPFLAALQRRRARDTFVSVERTNDADISAQISALLEALATLREAQLREHSALETRISDLESLFGRIASIPRKEVA